MVCWLECDVLFRESHVTFFMGAISGGGGEIQLVLSAEPQWGKARKCEKTNGEYKMVTPCCSGWVRALEEPLCFLLLCPSSIIASFASLSYLLFWPCIMVQIFLSEIVRFLATIGMFPALSITVWPRTHAASP